MNTIQKVRELLNEQERILELARSLEASTRERVGTRLRLLRESCGYSLRKVASISGFSAAFVSDVELGRRNVNEELLSTYSGILFAYKMENP
jgi:hypothetical protein